MKQILKDIIGFTTALNKIDLLLYFAVLVLIILVVSLIYIIKTSDEEEIEVEGENYIDNEDDLQSIVTNLENNHLPALELTDYEAEQEARAIISYNELLEKNKVGQIRYEESKTNNDEVSIKKIDLGHLTINTQKQQKNVVFLNYEREEEFLKNLQALNKLLN